jgi:cobalt-zinc-cadmium resistance protein CzcA
MSYKREKSVLLIFISVFLISIVIMMLMGSEFIPRLNEQIIQLETLLPKNTSLEETEQAIDQVHQIVQKFPQVENVFTRIGRGEAGTHPHPVNMGHSMITLKDKKSGTRKQLNKLIHQIEDQIKHTIPGASLNFTQPIKHNLDHLITGVRADLAVKIYGSDYHTLIHLAEQTSGILGHISGVKDTQVSRVSGQNEIRVTLNRDQLSRYGLNPGEVLEELEASFGGKNIAKAYVGDVVYDVFIRFASPYRQNITDLGRHLIHSDKGHMIPLSAVADIREDSSGFAVINRENGKRYISVQCNVRGRDIGSIVKESKALIFRNLDIPVGYFISWGGQFELKEKAERKLILIISITLILVMIILFDYLRSWKDILIILANLPVSLSGGILSLWLAGAFISVPSIIGFLALLGIALENTLVLITFFKRKMSGSPSLDHAIRESVSLRLRPILMTKFTTIIGLFPLLLSAGIGSEVQRPLAIVVVGGIFFSIFTTLILMPVLYKMLYRSEHQKV